jgi:uncharacterized membrane protein
MEDLLPGLHGAPNLHPVFLHFPLVLLITALGFAVVAALRSSDDLVRVTRWLLYLGVLSAIPTVATGYQAMLSLEGMPGHDLIHVHMDWMFTAAGLALVTGALAWWLGRRPPTGATRWSLAIALAVTCGVLTLGADRGALLVFRYGIGTQQETPPEDHGAHGGHQHGGDASGGGGHEHGK